ncbi:hypothetical protein, partial [Moryella indoligenes]|uniref:hypothetical protein n=1 Tax=Moryella indoligenes TaxID=371674 RepID=UPI0027D83AF5
IQNWRFAFKYAVFNLQTSISPYKLAPQITTQRDLFYHTSKSPRNQPVYPNIHRKFQVLGAKIKKSSLTTFS